MIDFYLSKKNWQQKLMSLVIKIESNQKKIKYKKNQKNILGTFIRINPNEKDFSAYDGLGKIQTFIDDLKDEELKKKETKLKN